MSFLRNIVIIIVSTTFFISCGGGAGGSGASEDLAAQLGIAVSPGAIDSGDRTTVKVFIDSVNDDGVVVKIRFPLGLRYIIGSSELDVAGKPIAVAPTTNVSDEASSYLVYYFKKRLIGDSSATLVLKLAAIDPVADGQVEVDADLNDPAVDDQDEFQIATPQFATQSSDRIIVEG